MQVIVILDVNHERVQASIAIQHPMNAAAFRGEIASGPASAEQSIAEARNAQIALSDAVAFARRVNRPIDKDSATVANLAPSTAGT